MSGLEYYITSIGFHKRETFSDSYGSWGAVLWELGLELVPGDRKDSARWRLGGMLVALLKAAKPKCACFFSSEWIYLALKEDS